MTATSERSSEELLESLTGLFVPVGEIEAVRVDTDIATSQLDAIATPFAGEVLGRFEQQCSNPLTTTIVSYVNTLQLTAPTAGVLEVLEDDHLADAHDLPLIFGNEYFTALSTGLFHG